jgi:hypothetical protein
MAKKYIKEIKQKEMISTAINEAIIKNGAEGS